MNIRSMTLCALAASPMLLVACGGSGGDGEGPNRYDTDYRQLRWADPDLEPLTNEHSPEAVSQFVRNGLRLQVSGGDDDMVEEGGVAMPDVSDNAAEGSDDYFRTNVHVEGVDEADRLKYDGRYLFVAESPPYSYHRFAESVALDEAPEQPLDEAPEQPLVSEGDCYLPETLNPDEGFADIVTVSAFNLREQRLVSAVCVNAHLSGLYMSLDSLYLGARAGLWQEEKTGLHKFAIAGGDIRYQGTGTTELVGSLLQHGRGTGLPAGGDHRVGGLERPGALSACAERSV